MAWRLSPEPRWPKAHPATAPWPRWPGSPYLGGTPGLGRPLRIRRRGACAFAAIAGRLRAARDAGRLRVEDPDTLARLFLGALTRGSMLIAASDQPKATRDDVARTVRALLQGLSA